MKFKFVVISFVVMMSACVKKDKASAQENSQTKQYAESKEDFPNPERGFYMYSHTKASNFTPLTANQLDLWKKPTQAAGGNYTVNSTLVFRYYELDIFKDKGIDPQFISSMQADFAAARQAGFKLIPRFTYTLTQKAGSCPEGFICPPYGDAAKAIVLQHIAELKTVLHDHADVIAVVQMGFIGVWGEQYYTDFFGDASQNTPLQKLTDNNWKDRLEVLQALLQAVPKNRMVQVRYPQIKQRLIYGINADVNVAPLQPGEAFSGSDKARIGYHNDCLLASTNDYGTFEDYGNSATPRRDANTVLRTFKKADSRFVAVGGETCNDSYSPQNDCEPLGRAQTEMRELHYSYLNSAYNNAVNNDWQTGGCMDSIKKNLGYRFVLKQLTLPVTVAPGKSLSLSMVVENRGYASPFNERPLRLILRNKSNGVEHQLPLQSDVRTWFSGRNDISENVMLPAGVTAGEYELFLSLPDAFTSIQKRPEYAIRLANEATWEATTGYNKLNTVLKVQ